MHIQIHWTTAIRVLDKQNTLIYYNNAAWDTQSYHSQTVRMTAFLNFNLNDGFVYKSQRNKISILFLKETVNIMVDKH
jgi:hypothetical protein